MRMRIAFYLLTALFFLVIGQAGCSGGNGGVLPGLDGGDVQTPGMSGTAAFEGEGHRIIGAGRIYFDNETGEVTNVPCRMSSAHYNVLPMVTPPRMLGRKWP